MKTISVPIITDKDQSMKYTLAYYPGDGLYLWEEGGELVQVNANGVRCIDISLCVPFSQIQDHYPSEVQVAPCEAVFKGGISEDLLLRAIAVASDPDVILRMKRETEGDLK